MLKTLALRGVAYDEPAKRLFHSEGRAALRRLAEALGLLRAFHRRDPSGLVTGPGEAKCRLVAVRAKNGP